MDTQTATGGSVALARTRGRVWDPGEREYIDMLSAYSAVNQGHCHPRIVAALVAQAQKLTLSSRAFHNSVFGVFAERVGQVFGYDMVLPMNTGAEAVESALKLARKWGYMRKNIPTGEAIILSVADNFHSRTLGVVSMSTDPTARTGFEPFLPGVGPRFRDEEAEGGERVLRFGEIADLERALELHGPCVAAFLVEPIQYSGRGGPGSSSLRQTTSAPRALCKKHNVLLICDEIQTGLGRTGRLLACQHEDVRPDVVLLGRGVPRVGGACGQGRDAVQSTYGGNPGCPLACAVSFAVLQVLLDVFRTAVKALNSPLIQTVRSLSLLNAVVIDEERCNAARRAQGLDIEGAKRRTAWQFCLLLKERGVLAKTTHGNVVRFAPPLVIEEADLLKAVKIIGECLFELDTREDWDMPTDKEH
ncbi:ornithine-oxo-acid aminotransferase [Mycena sanguinolenta]|nr:ornithine-oxo-acid aminotransferase [Mycena sanguinolenta]